MEDNEKIKIWLYRVILIAIIAFIANRCVSTKKVSAKEGSEEFIFDIHREDEDISVETIDLQRCGYVLHLITFNYDKCKLIFFVDITLGKSFGWKWISRDNHKEKGKMM